MFEAYVLICLIAVGYVLNLKNDTKPQPMPIQNYRNNIYNTRMYNEVDKEVREKTHIRSLTGDYIHREEFIHNNMTPGRVSKQNMDINANHSILEMYSGIPDVDIRKKEVESFADINRTTNNVYGNRVETEFFQSRIAQPMMQTNYFPIDKVYVGPGLNQGYSANPVGGYHQFDINEIAKKTPGIDELRVKQNPNPMAIGVSDVQRQVYHSRVTEGVKSVMPATNFYDRLPKNRPETFYEQTADMFLKTTGDYRKPAVVPETILHNVNRISTGHVGPGYNANKQIPIRPNNSVQPKKNTQENYNNAPPTINRGLGMRDDYGKRSVEIKSNERDKTGSRTYLGMLNSVLRGFTQSSETSTIPKKTININNPRSYGNVSISFPNKQMVHDPTNIMRTTIKETLIHDQTPSFIKPPTKIAINNPSAVAKKTIRETLKQSCNDMNLGVNVPKPMVVNNQKPKKTIKETTVDLGRERGNVNALEGGGAYETSDFTVNPTLKQITSDHEYTGQMNNPHGMGAYETSDFTVDPTLKQITSDHDYYGGADADIKKQTKHDYIDTYENYGDKEMTLYNRTPTTQGPTTYNTAENVNFSSTKKEEIIKEIDLDKIIQSNETLDNSLNTKDRRCGEESNRLDTNLHIQNDMFVSLHKTS